MKTERRQHIGKMTVGLLLWTIVVLAAIQGTESESPPRKKCPCKSPALCNRVLPTNNEMEVIVVTEGKSAYQGWMWDTIKTVITHNFTSPDLMCFAHSKKSKFGFIAEVPAVTSKDDIILEDFITNTQHSLKETYADVLVLDLMKLVGDCNLRENLIKNLTEIVQTVVMRVRPSTVNINVVMCILPWKPPCFDNNCQFFDDIAHEKIKNGCDIFITSPESYTTVCDSTCKAQATMPFQKLILGTDEYLTHIDRKRLMVGIPWHGYDYTCSQLSKKACLIPKITNSTNCDYEHSRQKVGLGLWIHDHPTIMLDNEGEWDDIQKAKFYNYNASNTRHQLWYEVFESLHEKYKFVKDMELKGIVIWTGDDLSMADVSTDKDTSYGMWSWLLHTLLYSGKTKSTQVFNYAGNMAGIGVGCFLFGTAMGVVIAALLFRKRFDLGKRNRPFQKDVDEYHDDQAL